ncbi:pilus assembly protein N-terminal domain-containing protein [Tepidicaulis sp. LMO-SS28]|uniref:pilus assembly protein N-terminal domain-containing protein n=1 Tax=Tepidicaulis sp. LMO-SS28 TaxID=3447455 RepID=UPI003EE26590
MAFAQGHPFRFMRALKAGAAFSLAALLAAPALAASLQVEVNQTKPYKLPRAANTVIVGNPAVAGVTVDSNDRVFVLGRTYGRTNLIALDRDGEIIVDMPVNVVNAAGIVTLNAGAQQRSFNCTPRCERVLDPTDAPEAFDQQLEATKGATDYIEGIALGRN